MSERPQTSSDEPRLIEQYATRIARRRRVRMVTDTLAGYGMGFGGNFVIIAILLIFIYLLYVVLPLFAGAELLPGVNYLVPAPAAGKTRHLALDEQNEVGVRYTDSGHIIFFKTADGSVISESRLNIPQNVSITSFAAAAPALATVAYGLSDGRAAVVKHAFKVSYPNDQRLITPKLIYPMGEELVVVDAERQPLVQLTLQAGEESLAIAAATPDNRVFLTKYEKEEMLLGESEGLTSTAATIPYTGNTIVNVVMDSDFEKLFIVGQDGNVTFFDISDISEPVLKQHLSMDEGSEITTLNFLPGGISLIIGTSEGRLVQWFPVRDEAGQGVLTRIREFDPLPGAIRQIIPEYQRKAFLALDDKGNLNIYHATAQRTVLETMLDPEGVWDVAISPRANAMLYEDRAGRIHLRQLHNEYPEISWSSLWGKVWYESYPQPEYIWQSSSASDIFEPKFSLTPISFGTLKAAFYAMLLAVPLAILGAIYTAHFMSPAMRRLVKPSVEIMEALPTVILGFLAGLWLAPIVEEDLPGILILMLIMPPGILLAAWLWQRLPPAIQHKIPEGWEGALLIPAVILIGYIAFALSPILEASLFDGDMQVWMSRELGIDYDQRNSIVVGLAMGFAVIPTIFSMTEDAIFAVPKHLVQGSLALGATPWQTMIRVVLLTASPGIFSAVMIGLGRAVGETMIVLMATGNTPVMDMSIFQGMRTLSANIAVEMPEAEVASTHYRVLFLAALVLFAFTFFVNTIAEIVRQRLRKRYSSL